MFLSAVPCWRRRQFALQESCRLKILWVLMAGSTVGKQGTESRLKWLREKQNHVPLKWPLRGTRQLCQPLSQTTGLRIFTTRMNLVCFIKLYPIRLCIWSLRNVWVGSTANKASVLVWLLQMLRVISCRCLSLANLQDQGVLLALETYPTDTDCKKRVGWTALCSKSGSGSLIERLWGKAEKMHLSWIIARPTHTLKDLRPFS